jgi:hypothetical protein
MRRLQVEQCFQTYPLIRADRANDASTVEHVALVGSRKTPPEGCHQVVSEREPTLKAQSFKRWKAIRTHVVHLTN